MDDFEQKTVLDGEQKVLSIKQYVKDEVEEEFTPHADDELQSRPYFAANEVNMKQEVKEEEMPTTAIQDKSDEQVEKVEQVDEEYDDDEDDESDEGFHETTAYVQFGPNQTSIHKRLIHSISWHCYKHATRTLLMALFRRDILGTHGLTGKKCHALLQTDAKPKPQLNVTIIEDIVSIVMKKCNVTKLDVRKIITRKCLNEHKKWNNRRNKKYVSEKKLTIQY